MLRYMHEQGNTGDVLMLQYANRLKLRYKNKPVK